MFHSRGKQNSFNDVHKNDKIKTDKIPNPCKAMEQNSTLIK